MNQEEYDIVLTKARNLCAKSEKCAGDIYTKNKTWKLPDSLLEKLITTLKEEGFIDHQRYAKAFANDKLRFNHWGKKKIQYALKSKFVEENLIEQALNEIDEKLYNSILHEEFSKKSKQLINKDKQAQKQKIIHYLVQKGFEYGKVFEFVQNEMKND
jgi:regulatory protein